MKVVKVKAGRTWRGPIEETTVTLIEADRHRHVVSFDGQRIGYVWKGSRTYSPPTHKGSRIVKYHKQVPEWHAGKVAGIAQHRRDTRQEVLRDLIAAHREATS